MAPFLVPVLLTASAVAMGILLTKFISSCDDVARVFAFTDHRTQTDQQCIAEHAEHSATLSGPPTHRAIDL